METKSQEHLGRERPNFDFFTKIPEIDRNQVKADTVKGSQLLEPLFEFSGCAGCGETPYLKLLTQLYGDRLIVANATGCSSIYGGNLPTTPWAKNREGRGPAWSNSLFEDNAEFGLGMRLAVNQQEDLARDLLAELAPQLGEDLAASIRHAHQESEEGIREQRGRVAQLKERLSTLKGPEATALLAVADTLVRRSVWIVGGDGWAYDIGFGGLDHVLASGRNVNVLVLDTEVYSNTGGQASKATPRRGGQVRRPGQSHRQERPGHDRGRLRQRLCRPGRDGGQPVAEPSRLPGGRFLQRALADHRLQPLHRPWHRDVHIDEPPERGGRQRLLAPLPLRSAQGQRGDSSVSPRQPQATPPVQGLRHEGGPFRHAHPVQPRTCRAPAVHGPARHRRALAFLRTDGGPRAPAPERMEEVRA